jgi:hypothetical protein
MGHQLIQISDKMQLPPLIICGTLTDGDMDKWMDGWGERMDDGMSG